MARIILAGARTQAASQTGDLAVMRSALADIAAAEAWAQHSLPLLLVSCRAHRVAAGLHNHVGNHALAKTEAAAADRASERLEAFHPNPQALQARLEHLALSGSFDQALERARKWAREVPDSNLELYSVWALVAQGDLQASLELSRRNGDDPMMRLLRFLAALDTPSSRAETELVLQEVSTHPPEDLTGLCVAVTINLLVGRTEQAQEVTRDFMKRKSGSLKAPLKAILSVYDFLAGDISEETLLKAAEGPQAICLARHYVGLRHLAVGDRELARRHLQASRDSGVAGGEIAHILSVYFLKCLEKNPDWPPTIPIRQGQQP